MSSEMQARELLADEMQAEFPATTGWLRDGESELESFPSGTQAAIRALIQLAEQRAKVLEALVRAESRLRKLSEIDCGCRPCRGVCRTGRGAEAELEGRMETAAEYADETLKAIANATQQRNATGGKG